MIEFWRDYKEYQKSAMTLSKVWYKKHWKGTIVCTVLYIIVLIGVTFGWVFHNSNKETISELNSMDIEEDAE